METVLDWRPDHFRRSMLPQYLFRYHVAIPACGIYRTGSQRRIKELVNEIQPKLLGEIYSKEEFKAAMALFDHNSFTYGFEMGWNDIGDNRRRLYLNQVRAIFKAIQFEAMNGVIFNLACVDLDYGTEHDQLLIEDAVQTANQIRGAV